MIPARYLFRMDDITPTMNWDRFSALLSLFQRFKVKPLLGIVPDNRDPKLQVSPPREDFGEQMRALRAREEVEFAQHGYQHLLRTVPPVADSGHSRRSEFSGLSYEEQREKIVKGRTILLEQGIETTVWMAPSHSFDSNTLKALRDTGFTALSDGISLFPFKQEGIICIPQQLWKPKWMPTGTITICLHSDEITVEEIARIRQFLNMRPQMTTFSQEIARYREPGIAQSLIDRSFRTLYAGARRIRKHTSPPRMTNSNHYAKAERDQRSSGEQAAMG